MTPRTSDVTCSACQQAKRISLDQPPASHAHLITRPVPFPCGRNLRLARPTTGAADSDRPAYSFPRPSGFNEPGAAGRGKRTALLCAVSARRRAVRPRGPVPKGRDARLHREARCRQRRRPSPLPGPKPRHPQRQPGACTAWKTSPSSCSPTGKPASTTKWSWKERATRAAPSGSLGSRCPRRARGGQRHFVRHSDARVPLPLHGRGAGQGGHPAGKVTPVEVDGKKSRDARFFNSGKPHPAKAGQTTLPEGESYEGRLDGTRDFRIVVPVNWTNGSDHELRVKVASDAGPECLYEATNTAPDQRRLLGCRLAARYLDRPDRNRRHSACGRAGPGYGRASSRTISRALRTKSAWSLMTPPVRKRPPTVMWSRHARSSPPRCGATPSCSIPTSATPRHMN